MQSWAGRAGQVGPGVQPLAEVAHRGRMVVQIPAGTASGGILHVQRPGVLACRRNTHARSPGTSAAGREMHVRFPAERAQPATARATAWRERCPRGVCTCKFLAAATSGPRMHVQNPTRMLSAGDCTSMFLASATPAASWLVHVAGGRLIAHKMHELTRGGSDSGRDLHGTRSLPHRSRAR